MSEAAGAGATPSTQPTAMSLLGTLVLVVAAIAALLAIDTFLANLDQAARRSEATHLFSDGRRLASEGREREAIERFRSALSIDRGNRTYRLALAHTLFDAGRLQEADSTLVGLLHDDATDGDANLALARVLVGEGQVEEAASYYHRAIYGLWKRDAEGNRTVARLELIELLARTGAKQELLAELLPLEGTGITDSALRRRVGHLFVQAGSPGRGAAIFRDLLRHNARDADSYAGLGEAEFATGNYRAAAANLRAAVRLQPRDQETARRLQLLTQVLALDPMQRGLGSAERERRAGELLQLAIDAAERCLGPGLPDTVRTTVDTAKARLATPTPAARLDEAFEAKLDLAERLHALGTPGCRQERTAPDRALDLVLAKLSD